MTSVEDLATRIGRLRVESEMEAPDPKTDTRSVDPLDAVILASAAMSGKSRQEKVAAFRDMVPGGRVTIEDGTVTVGPQEKPRSKAARWREWAEKLTAEQRADYLEGKYMELDERQQQFVSQTFAEIEEAEDAANAQFAVMDTEVTEDDAAAFAEFRRAAETGVSDAEADAVKNNDFYAWLAARDGESFDEGNEYNEETTW